LYKEVQQQHIDGSTNLAYIITGLYHKKKVTVIYCCE